MSDLLKLVLKEVPRHSKIIFISSVKDVFPSSAFERNSCIRVTITSYMNNYIKFLKRFDAVFRFTTSGLFLFLIKIKPFLRLCTLWVPRKENEFRRAFHYFIKLAFFHVSLSQEDNFIYCLRFMVIYSWLVKAFSHF